MFWEIKNASDLNNSIITYNYLKKLESNGINILSEYICSNFIKKLMQKNMISCELIGIFTDIYGPDYSGIFVDEEYFFYDNELFENFLVENSNYNKEEIHNFLLYQFSLCIDRRIKNDLLDKSKDVVIKMEPIPDYFKKKICIKKDYNEDLYDTIEALECIIDDIPENKDLINLIHNIKNKKEL